MILTAAARVRFVIPALLLTSALGAPVLGAQTATVSGVVYDSIAQAPLRGATVQLESVQGGIAGRAAVSDSLGRFSISGVANGRYALGFLHPMLDSLGVEPIVRAVVVERGQSVRADLAIPSLARMRAAMCGTGAAVPPGGLIAGSVRDAGTGAASSGVVVRAEWVEISFTAQGVSGHVSHEDATTRDNGWFVICGAPNTGLVALSAARGADSTSVAEFDVPPGGLLLRDLSIGAAGARGRVVGLVTTVKNGQPVAGAQVSVGGGPAVRTNEHGEFALDDVPYGTRVLDVRAIGYYPTHQPVDVASDTPRVHVSIVTMAAMLDTIRINASRALVKHNGFDERRHTGMGHYLTAADIERRSPVRTSDLFKTIPGASVDSRPLGQSAITLRSTFGGRCVPAVYIDGHYIPEVSADDIDAWANPDEIEGIEIYSGAMVPPQFSMGRDGPPCGSIVIWTRLSIRQRVHTSWMARGMTLLGVAAFGIILGTRFHH